MRGDFFWENAARGAPNDNATKTMRGTPVDVESDVGPYNADPGAIQGWDPPHEQAFYISANIWW